MQGLGDQQFWSDLDPLESRSSGATFPSSRTSHPSPKLEAGVVLLPANRRSERAIGPSRTTNQCCEKQSHNLSRRSGPVLAKRVRHALLLLETQHTRTHVCGLTCKLEGQDSSAEVLRSMPIIAWRTTTASSPSSVPHTFDCVNCVFQECAAGNQGRAHGGDCAQDKPSRAVTKPDVIGR